MLKKIGFVLVAVMAFAGCKDKESFTIEGKFENYTPQAKVYLYKVEKADEKPLDSTVLSDKGDFKFSNTTPDVDFFRVKIDKSEYMLIAKNGDHIKLSADLANKSFAYTLSGAAEADKLEELNKNRNQYFSRMAVIQSQFEETVAAQPQNRDMIANQMRPALIKENEDLINYTLKFAMENTNSLAGFYAINSLNPDEYAPQMLEYADKIRSNFNKNAAVTDFLVRMAKLKTVQSGAVAPDFTINTIDGKKIKLSDFKGKYVLLDFWASWCQPCRQENPNVVKAYQSYKNNNFTVFSVSLDKDPSAWKQAVEEDHLAWTHASDLKDFEGPSVRLYQVESIPSSFLIDPSGKIIAKNLRGSDLEEFLNRTLPKS